MTMYIALPEYTVLLNVYYYRAKLVAHYRAVPPYALVEASTVARQE